MSQCQLTRVTPSSADHPHAAEPYSPDEGKCNLPRALVVSIVRLESKVERHCVLGVRQYAAIWTRQEESVSTRSGSLEDFHGEVAPACLVLSGGGGPGVSSVWFPAAAAVVRGGVGCGCACGGRRGSWARHWPVAGEIRRRAGHAGRGDCHCGCLLGATGKSGSHR